VHRSGNGTEHIVVGPKFKFDTIDDAAAVVNPDITEPEHIT